MVMEHRRLQAAAVAVAMVEELVEPVADLVALLDEVDTFKMVRHVGVVLDLEVGMPTTADLVEEVVVASGLLLEDTP